MQGDETAATGAEPKAAERGRHSPWARLLNPWVAIPATLLALALTSPFVYRASRLNSVPPAEAPFDVAAFGTVAFDPAENAFGDYRSASAAFVALPTGAETALTDVMDHGWKHATPELEQWLEDNRPALEAWRRGTTKPQAVYHQPKDLRWHTTLEVVQKLRDLTRAAVVEGKRLEAAGDLRGAWESYLAVMRCSRHLGRHGGAIERLVGIANHAVGTEAIEQWSRHPELDAERLRAAAEVLERVDAGTPANATMFKAEYLLAANSLREISVSDLPKLLTLSGGGPRGAATTTWMWLNHEPELGLRVMRHAFANWLTAVDEPRHVREARRRPGRFGFFEPPASTKPDPDAVSPEELQAAAERSPVGRAVLPLMSKVLLATDRERARQATLVLALQLRAWRREHGAYPDSLQELVPDYLPAVPADPLALKAGETIRYANAVDGPRVWSVGENGVDDGGTMLEWGAHSGDAGVLLEPPLPGAEPEGPGAEP